MSVTSNAIPKTESESKLSPMVEKGILNSHAKGPDNCAPRRGLFASQSEVTGMQVLQSL